MKKLICISFLLLVGTLAGCSAEDVKVTYALTTEYDGYKTEESIVLYGTDDDTLNKMEETVTITFENGEDAISDMEAYKQEFTAFTPESKYIVFDWSETENTLVVSIVTNFKQAMKDKTTVYKNEIYSAGEYYSIEETTKDYIAEGYELVVEAE